MDFAYIGMVLLLVFGFGFVIFWHELGHFLAAKWAGVEVEQFAVGFGHAMFSWRKGMGFQVGSSRTRYEAELQEYLRKAETQDDTRAALEALPNQKRRFEYAAEQLKLSETEYRLNWVPLGGYVKMLGQDDMNPNAISESPRAYNNKPIGKRMVIVSAGVVMNIILAIILFTVLFRIGFNVPPAVVGTVAPYSPAQEAGIRVGDTILDMDGRWQADFTKISLNVALVEQGQPVPVRVRRADGTVEALTVIPRRNELDSGGFLQIGIGPSFELRGIDSAKLTAEDKKRVEKDAVRPDEKIIAIDGVPVTDADLKKYVLLDSRMQSGKPFPITVRDAQGASQERTLEPHLLDPFGKTQLNFAGLAPRVVIDEIVEGSPAKDLLKPGDIVTELTVLPSNDVLTRPSRANLMQTLDKAGQNDFKVNFIVLRDGQVVHVDGLTPNVKVTKDRRGLNLILRSDDNHAVVADVLDGSAAAKAGIPTGATIRSINAAPVTSWNDVQRVLIALTPGKPVAVELTTAAGENKTISLPLTFDDIASVARNRYVADLALHELEDARKTHNPVEAARWGIAETRDLMVQFYLTLQRMVQRSVPASGAMGPVGIFTQGSKVASRGIDWLLWFLAMISANLAVVNFLPIPIVDGGLFVFLILEKIMRRPLSARTQSIAQIVGLALIASVFLFVTYNDITRMF